MQKWGDPELLALDVKFASAVVLVLVTDHEFRPSQKGCCTPSTSLVEALFRGCISRSVLNDSRGNTTLHSAVRTGVIACRLGELPDLHERLGSVCDNGHILLSDLKLNFGGGFSSFPQRVQRDDRSNTRQ